MGPKPFLEQTTAPEQSVNQVENFDPIFDTPLGPVVHALAQLTPSSQKLVSSMVRQLAEREGISVVSTANPGLKTPAEGISLWIAKLKSEQYAERTIDTYQYYVKRYLAKDPAPTKLRIQSYLAQRLEQVSTAMVSNERKALSSFFSFLHSEGLWPINPLNGVRHVKVRYRERLCPDMEDVQKVLSSSCYRRRDTEKLRTLVLLLATTGLRISEAAGILKRNIDINTLEVIVTGKGDKQRVVPLLPSTANALANYIDRYSNGSPYIFPNELGTGHMCANSFDKTLRRACIRIGAMPFTPHQLRHFYATSMLKGGAKVEVVARILGHAGVGVTCDIYRHVATAELHQEHTRFAPLNGGTMLL